jgi:RNA 3'-terminal phosphate cyclase (ATP)
MRKIGFDIRLELNLAGFYPKGGGRIQASIQPAASLSPLQLTQRGALQRIRGISAVANLELSVAERQKKQTLSRLRDHSLEAEIKVLRMPSRFKGSMLLLRAEFEHSDCCYFGLGARGKPAEQVADEAVDGLEAFLATDGVIDPYLADQLILPLALASGVSELRTSKVTSHLLTNADIIQMFLPVEIQIIGDLSHPGLIQITP